MGVNGVPHLSRCVRMMDSERVPASSMIWVCGCRATSPLHEPPLLPYAIGRRQSDWKDGAFRRAEPDLAAPLREFEPPRRSAPPEQPFWWLRLDRRLNSPRVGPTTPKQFLR